jgi:flagellar hook protein FlgE
MLTPAIFPGQQTSIQQSSTMTRSLLTGASGLLAHQQKLEVVANNIANINTTAFKTQNVNFADLIYTDRSSAVGANGQRIGGINPTQIGNGVRLGEISSNFSQGVLEATGAQYDFAIEGDGFFVVQGAQQQFTRDGSFSVDSDGYLVDPGTGLQVQRTGAVGEAINGENGFQVAGDTRIRIPLGVSVPGSPTTNASFRGNLPASAVPALTEIRTTSIPLTQSDVAAVGTTLLNDLDLNTEDYVTGDSIEIFGTNADGTPFSISLPVDPTTTLNDLVNAADAAITGGTVSLLPNGNIQILADAPGDVQLDLQLSDDALNTGQTRFADNIFVAQTEGKDPDEVVSTIQIFDTRGEPHAINVAFTKQDFNSWSATFTSATDSTTLTDNEITEIRFSERGDFQAVNGLGDGDSNIRISINSLAGSREIEFDLADLTHRATNYSATFDQDGFSPGTIVALNASADGTLTGVASNGRRVDVAQLAIARFSNNQGLENAGDNYFIQTANSGSPEIGTGQTSGRGTIRGSQLESSNVDLALEFTQLIIAQRAFSASARSITVATEVLQELNNLF